MFFLNKALFILLPLFLFADIALKQEYCFEKDDILLKDFAKEANSSDIFFHFTDNITKYQILSGKIIAALKEVDINATSNFSVIELKRNCNASFPKEFITSEVKAIFMENYPLLDIKKLSIEPKNELDFEMKQKYIKDIIMTDTVLKKDRGSFYVKYEKDRIRRIYFDFKIEADLTLLKLKSKMDKGEKISINDVEKEIVIFDKISSFPASAEDLEDNMLTRYLRSGDIVYQRDLSQITLIKKNSNIKALIKDGAVELFFDVIALDDGNLDDVIMVRKSNGKQYSAKIIGKNRVLIK